jgi:predicted DNA-binding transcriptional regulator AlpA
MAPPKENAPRPFPEQTLSLDDLDLIRQTSVAELLGKTRRTVQRMSERGELPPPISLARDQFYRKQTILSYLAKRQLELAQRKQPSRPRRQRPRGQ